MGGVPHDQNINAIMMLISSCDNSASCDIKLIVGATCTSIK